MRQCNVTLLDALDWVPHAFDTDDSDSVSPATARRRHLQQASTVSPTVSPTAYDDSARCLALEPLFHSGCLDLCTTSVHPTAAMVLETFSLASVIARVSLVGERSKSGGSLM